jgi:Tfp pilus assembly protein FimT
MRSDLRHSNAFTLIELVLVMTLLIIIVSLVTPKLESFIGHRSLDSEVRRFVSLTHYGQSRAVSEGIPMVLWVDPGQNTYGLEEEPGYADADTRALNYTMEGSLAINVDRGSSPAPAKGKRSGIHFSPDGNIVTATSVAGVSMREGNRDPVWIKPAHDGLSYEVQN